MRWKSHHTVGDHNARTVRLAWWASFLLTIALLAILGFARSAQAVALPGPNAGGAASAQALSDRGHDEPEDEDEFEAEASEGEEFDDWECEVDDEECEEEAEEEAESSSEAPEECLLSSADATVFASPGSDRLRFVLRYRTSSPTDVAFDYGLHGAKGSLYLGGDKRHLGGAGVVRLTQDLGEAQMAKVMAARDFAVRLHVRGAPGYCHRFFERQLTVRRAAPGGLAWSQAD